MATITDNFQSYTAGAISGQGNWTNGRGAYTYIVNVSGDMRVNSGGGGEYAAYRTDNFGNNQFVQARVDAIGWGYVGVILRASGLNGTFYCFSAKGKESEFYLEYYHQNTASTVEGVSGVGISAGDLLRLEIEGTTLRLYINGSLITSLGDNGDIDVSSIISSYPALGSGRIGVIVEYDSGGHLDDFEGGDLSSASQISGSMSLALAPSGSIIGRKGSSGSVGLALAPSGSIIGRKGSSGTVALVLAPSGSIIGRKGSSGTVAMVLAPSGSIMGRKGSSGTVALALALNGFIENVGEGPSQISGSMSLALAPSGSIIGRKGSSGTVALVLAPSGSIIGRKGSSGIVALVLDLSGRIISHGFGQISGSISMRLWVGQYIMGEIISDYSLITSLFNGESDITPEVSEDSNITASITENSIIK